jgi:hypothetical protein
MFNLTAFTSTLLLIGLLALVYTGALFYLHHSWAPARYTGLFTATFAFAAIVSHIVWLVI